MGRRRRDRLNQKRAEQPKPKFVSFIERLRINKRAIEAGDPAAGKQVVGGPKKKKRRR